MLPDARWLDFLKATSWQLLAIALGCALLIVGDTRGVFPIGLDPLLKGALLVVSVLSAFLWAASIGPSVSAFVDARVKRLKSRRAIRAHADEFRKYIPYMTGEERAIFAQLLHENRKSFTADVDGGHAATLIGRRYIIVLAVKGQSVAYDDVPFAIPDHIWEVAVQHKAEFPFKPDRDGADAWRVHWMAR